MATRINNWASRRIGLAVLCATAGLAARADAGGIPPGVEMAGPIALKQFLPSLDTPQVRAGFGFEPGDNLQALTLGKPFQIFILLPDAIRNHRPGTLFQRDLIPQNAWFFAVYSHARAACLMSVTKRSDGVWTRDQLGMTRRGQAWAAINAAWPESKGYGPVLVQSINPNLLLFTVPEYSFANLTPVDLDRDPAHADYTKLRRADATFEELKRHMSANE